MRRKPDLLALVALVATALFLWPPSAGAQDEGQGVPSVGVAPADPDPDDPNGGQWFLIELLQGESGRLRARIVNPADVAQRVRMYLADLQFTDSGTPVVNDDEQLDVGLWGSFLNPEITIPAGASVEAEFAITVPRDAEPGDHVGVVVVETLGEAFEAVDGPEGAQFTVSRRVATRLYVTVPGEATRSLEVLDVSLTSVRSAWLPREALVEVTLRNDGNVRLRPTVTIGDASADGPAIFMSASVEKYSAVVPVPWYGGPVSIPVEVVTEGGITRRVNATKFIIPWGLLIALALLAAGMWRIRRWWNNRGSKQAGLKADIERLERLIVSQGGEAPPQTVPSLDDATADEVTVLNATLARARRSGDDAALARGALALHATTEAALDVLLEALGSHDGKYVTPLVDAAAAYGADAVATNPRTAKLPEALRERIGARVLVVATGGGNGTAPAAADLAGVRGLGPAKQEALIARFGSLDGVRDATVEDLTTVKGVGPKLAQEIHDHLR